ncbi:MAG TPA: hypothetical protein VHS97_21500 [Isosphaeraceae bacterium]|nr:hypothetical protein [Isosphaeraceae bacterium]
MRAILWKLRPAALLTALGWLFATPEAHAQSISSIRSLGGYGATTTSPMASMSSSSPMIPYAGSFAGFMPYRMASGASSPLSFSPRGSSAPELTRTPFRLSPMSSGMGAGLRPDSGLFAPLGSQGAMRSGGGLLSQPMGGGTNTSVMPPNFGYPFYQPPSLFSPVSSGSGMSM